MEISRNWVTAHFLTFMVDLGTVMAATSVFLSLLLCCSEYTEVQDPVEVD